MSFLMLTFLILSPIPLEGVTKQLHGINCWWGLDHNIGDHKTSFSLLHIHLVLLM